ncbi:MAG: cell wall hydrolase [Bradyrhizobiaceae bacterium]|nr:cell wall hydrolase [Bradyrhizobiaceae bacterium]
MPGRTGLSPARPAVTPAAASPYARTHLLASPFGTIHTATFGFPQPVGTQVPVATLDLADYEADDGTLSTDGGSHGEIQTVNRRLKGPRLVPRRRPDPGMPRPAATDGSSEENAGRENNDGGNAGRDVPKASSPAGHDPGVTRPGASRETADQILMARIYSATAPDLTPVAPDHWPEEAAEQYPPEGEARPQAPDAPPPGGTAAPPDDPAGAGHRPKSPAELLGLTDANRARHEKCLANAIYFEARGETVRGQMAVAQVVINRVFSGHYPGNICGVVYQSTRRYHRLRCQFSFTCDGIPDRINEPDAFERATQIARDALDGRFWLTDIGKATHYHARWVHPRWVREMRRLHRIGVHTFYRPRRWGDGERSPVWGDAEATGNAARAL